MTVKNIFKDENHSDNILRVDDLRVSDINMETLSDEVVSEMAAMDALYQSSSHCAVGCGGCGSCGSC